MMESSLDARLRHKLFRRMFFLQSWWSFESMQGVGFFHSAEPWLRRIYGDSQEFKEAAVRHLEFFNTNPYMEGFVLAVVGSMEERAADLPPEERRVANAKTAQLKKAMASSFAAIGDSIFWGTVRPALAAGAALFIFAWVMLSDPGFVERTQLFYLWAAGVYFVIYNLIGFWIRWQGLVLGWKWKEELPIQLRSYRWQEKVREVRRLGLAAAVLACLVLLWSHPLSLGNRAESLALIAAGIGLRSLGLSASKIYALGLAGSLLVALVVP